MNKLVVLALAGVVGVSGQASGTDASPAPTATTAVPTNPPLATAAPGIPSDFSSGIPADFGMGIVNPSTLPSKPLPIAAGTTPVLPRAGSVVSPMTSTSMMPRTGFSPMSMQAQFDFQSAAANLQAQVQAMNGNFNGQVYFGTPTIVSTGYMPGYMPPYYNGIKSPFGMATPVASPMMSELPAGFNVFGAYQSAPSQIRVSGPTYGTPSFTSNYASVSAALAGMSSVPGMGAPMAGLPPGATNLGPSSLISIPGAFISGIKYGSAY